MNNDIQAAPAIVFAVLACGGMALAIVWVAFPFLVVSRLKRQEEILRAILAVLNDGG